MPNQEGAGWLNFQIIIPTGHYAQMLIRERSFVEIR